MKNTNLFPLERNRYFYGKLLTVRDFEIEQTYMNNKRRLINKVLMGSGVACGLGVTQADDFTLIVESGLALDYQGREVVVDSPVVRKLQMIKGYEGLGESTQAYLCIRYDETPVEAVNAVASDTQNTQYNKTQEGYELYLSTEEPDIPAILTAAGFENVRYLYQSADVTMVFSMPQTVLAGEEFPVRIMILKNVADAPVSFSLDLESEFIRGLDDSPHIHIEMNENPLEQKRIRIFETNLRAEKLPGSMVELAPSGGTLSIRCGDMAEAVKVELQCETFICENSEARMAQLAIKDNLRQRLDIEDLPIYLAKLQIIPAGASSLIASVYPLPFSQRLVHEGTASSGASTGLQVTSAVEVLKYWQTPQAQAIYNHSTGSLDFRFGIPAAQEYDYATSSGVVEIPMSSGMRVNARYISEEIPHNLGMGNVSITLGVEFQSDGEEEAQFFGNREVFKGRFEGAPQVQTAAILYPQRGTFKIGVWLLDNVEGSLIRVRYYASKVVRDLNAVKMADKVSMTIIPEVQRIRVRERLHLKAVVYGSNDRSVTWAVKDQDGGSIDKNGLYQAPDVKGTYEIVATSNASPDVKVSSFVIVEE